MTDSTDEYRANAEYCRRMADRVLSPLDKEMWLQVAWDWSVLASVRERYGTRPAPGASVGGPLMPGPLDSLDLGSY